MADGKWIHELRPELSLRQAAEIALSARLAVVRRHLPVAVESAADDPEHVHQLRVGIRRAGAALRTFKKCLPKARYRGAKELLRAIRSVAGDARDWDVFQEMLASSDRLHGPATRAAFDFLSGYSAARRIDAQEALVANGERWAGDLECIVDDLLRHIGQPRSADLRTLGELALAELQELIEELESASDPIPERFDALHEVRILGKRLRYAMELFAECFAPPFRDRLYPLVEELQEVLGRANDSHVTGQCLTAIRAHLEAFRPRQWPAYQPGIEALLDAHAQRLLAERAQFVEWLPRWREALADLPLDSLRVGYAGVSDRAHSRPAHPAGPAG